jgi:hypothetical protein
MSTTTAEATTATTATTATLPTGSRVMINDDGTFRHGTIVQWIAEDKVEVEFKNFEGTFIVDPKNVVAAPKAKEMTRTLYRTLSGREF